MKYCIFISAVVLMLCSCGKEGGTKNGASTEAGQQAINPNPVSAAKNTPDRKAEPGDAVPAMSDLGEGNFTELGLINAFEQATGIPLPKSVKPKSGKFRVWNEKDFGGKNRSYHTTAFAAPPNELLALADAIESKWKATYGASPDIRIYRSPAGNQEFSQDGIKFLPGSFALQLKDHYASYSELSAQLNMDPASGNILLIHYRGTEDIRSSRQDEEYERQQEERDAKAQAEADAKWGKNPESK